MWASRSTCCRAYRHYERGVRGASVVKDRACGLIFLKAYSLADLGLYVFCSIGLESFKVWGRKGFGFMCPLALEGLKIFERNMV